MPPTSKQPASRVDATTGNVIPMSSFEKFCRVMATRAVAETEERSFDETVIEDILTAETEEEMWTADDRGPLGGRDLAGVRMICDKVEVKWSSNQEIRSPFTDPDSGRVFYLLITSHRTDDAKYTGKRPDIKNGDPFQWNTSAPRLVAKLMWLEGHNRLNQDVIIESIELGAGQQVLKLRPAPSGFVNQSGPTLDEASAESPDSPF